MDVLISVKNLSKSFAGPAGTLNILKNITLDLHRGEMAAIMGPSGVGKSTFLHILGALERPSSGSVFFEDKDVFTMGPDALADFRNKKIGFVFQFHHLLPEFNALENTMMPALISGVSRTEAYKTAEAVLGEVGLSGRMYHRPGELSGGEQQRVAVARALALSPKVILADEPTGNLDTGTGEELFSLMKDLNKKGMTFLIVTHNESLASGCNRTIKMLDGRIV